MKLIPLLVIVAVCACGQAPAEVIPVKAELLSVERIWDQAPHNAFTDLIRYSDKFYCAFREGTGHVEGLGKIRVLICEDGVSWQSTGLLEIAGMDLRDAHLAATPDDGGDA